MTEPPVKYDANKGSPPSPDKSRGEFLVPTDDDVRRAQARLVDSKDFEPFSRPPFPFCLRQTVPGHWELYAPLTATTIDEAIAAAWHCYILIGHNMPSDEDVERWSRGGGFLDVELHDQHKARIEGYKAAMAVVRRMALDRGRPDYYTAVEWLEKQGRARWHDFDKVQQF